MRNEGKSEGRRMTKFENDIIDVCKKHGIKQSFVAKLFDISPGAVSQHYKK
jgi:predicted transcriptional regulator